MVYLFDGCQSWLIHKYLAMANIRRSEELFEHNVHSSEHFCHEEIIGRLIQRALLALVPSLRSWKAKACRWRATNGLT